MKIPQLATLLGTIVMVGAGCVTTSQPQTPQALIDGNSYKQAASGSIPLGLGESYRPADPAPPTSTSVDPKTGDQTNSNESEATTQPVKNTVVNQPNTPAVIDYNDALVLYRNKGAYIQFASCRGNPGSLSIKKNTKFMLDNRDSVSRTIVVGKVQYNIARYGFAIATTPNLPGTYYITCNGGGSAAILVQN